MTLRTVVWLGGHAYDATEDEFPADYRYRETNVMTDMAVSQIVFNDSDLPLWQIPQDAFFDLIASRSELLVRMRPHGPLGAHLFDNVGARVDVWSRGINMGETYAFGDESVVLLPHLEAPTHQSQSRADGLPGPGRDCSQADCTRTTPTVRRFACSRNLTRVSCSGIYMPSWRLWLPASTESVDRDIRGARRCGDGGIMEIIASARNGILATIGEDGIPQLSNIYYLANPSTQVVRFSTTTDRIKGRNLYVIRGRCSMCPARTSSTS